MTRSGHRAPVLAPPGVPEETAARATPDPLLPLAQRASGGDREALARLLSLIAPSVVASSRNPSTPAPSEKIVLSLGSVLSSPCGGRKLSA